MLMNSEMMKQMIHQVSMMSLTRKMEPGCNSGDCSIRVQYLDICFVVLIQQFETENTFYFRE